MTKIENAVWLAELEAVRGGNLTRLLHKPSGLEILRGPASEKELKAQPERFGIPPLMPPNRIDAGRFEWNGETIRLPVNETARNNHLHGLVLGREWKLESSSKSAAKTVFVHDESAPSFTGFPFKFKLSLEYRLEETRLLQIAEMESLSEKETPFGLGFHTAFALPAPDAKVWISAPAERWEIEDVRKLPTGRAIPWESAQTLHLPGGQTAEARPISAQCRMSDGERDGKPFRGATIESKSRGVRIVYAAGKEYGQWCLWNDLGGHGFVCVEPMTCMANAFNMKLPRELCGAAGIAPFGKWRAETSVAVETL